MAPKQGKRKSSGGDSAKAARKAKEARVTCPATEAITSWPLGFDARACSV